MPSAKGDPRKHDPLGRPSSAARNRGLPKTEEELPSRSEGELLGGEGRTEDVAREPVLARGDADGGVERAAGAAGAERGGSRRRSRGSGLAQTRDGRASLGTEGLTSGDRTRVASGEKGLLGCRFLALEARTAARLRAFLSHQVRRGLTG